MVDQSDDTSSSLSFCQPCVYGNNVESELTVEGRQVESFQDNCQDLTPTKSNGRRRRSSMPENVTLPLMSAVQRPNPPSFARRGSSSVHRNEASSLNHVAPPVHPPTVHSRSTASSWERQQQQGMPQQKQQQQQQARAPQNNNRASQTNENGNISDNDSSYQLGQTLRHPSHSLPFTSPSMASALLSKLPLGSPLFAKRTSREWTYAILVDRVTDPTTGEISIVVSLDDKRKGKKVLERGKWEKCLRLFNEKAVGSSRARQPSSSSVQRQRRSHSTDSFLGNSDRTRSKGGQIVDSAQQRALERRATACSIGTTEHSSDSFLGNSTDRTQSHEGHIVDAQRALVATLSDNGLDSTTAAATRSFQRRATMAGSIGTTEHSSDSFLSNSHTMQSHEGQIVGAQLARVVAAAANGNARDSVWAPTRINPRRATMAGSVDTADHSSAMLAIQRAHARSVDRRNSTAGLSTSFASTTSSEIALCSMAEMPVRRITSMNDLHLAQPISAPSNGGPGGVDPAYSSNPIRSGRDIIPNPSPKAFDVSPSTVAVNLNARNFCGSRRDRMRPASRNKNSAPGLVRLGSLDGTGSSSGSSDSSDSSICTRSTYGNAAYGGTGGGFSSRHSWSSSSSSYDYPDYLSSAPPPYATTTTAAPGGGIKMRLRGVDP